MRSRQKIKNFKKKLYHNHVAMFRLYRDDKPLSYRKWLRLVSNTKLEVPFKEKLK